MTSEERLEIKVAEGVAWGMLKVKVVGARLKREEVAMLVGWHGRKLERLKQSCQVQGLEAALEVIWKLLTWKSFFEMRS